MSDSLFSVEGQVVLLSGASRGIGFELARGFAAAGAQVVVTGREERTIREAAEKLSKSSRRGMSVEGMVCDVARLSDIRRLVAGVIERYKRIDTLVNVAGVNRRRPAIDVTEEDYDFILDVNLKGAYLLSLEVARHMMAAGKGSQINIDSLNTYSPLKGVIPYAMSKNGMYAMTRGLALEWGPHSIRVNGIAPGFIETDLTSKLWEEQEMRKWALEVTPVRRLGKGEDLVGTALFLASDAAAFLTGQTIRVDGGASAGTNWPISL